MNTLPNLLRRLAFAAPLLLLAGSAAAQQTAAPAPAEPSSAAAPRMTMEEKMQVKELTRIPNELGAKLPFSMRLDDPEFASLFPLAVGKENPYWWTLGADEFLVFRYPKSEPFRERTGRFIKAPGDANWSYLVAEDDTNFYFQHMPPGTSFSAMWRLKNRTMAVKESREAAEQGQREANAAAGGDPQKVENLQDYLGAPGWKVPADLVTVVPPKVDVLEFRDSSAGLPDSGLWQMDTALADLNGDGKLDIAVPPARKEFGGRPHVFLGDGKGNWRHWDAAKWPSDLAFDYGDVGVADFDGDGHADLALAMHFKGVYVLYGDGQGDFTRYFRFFDGTGFTSRALAIADFDGDKRPDLAVFSEINMDPKTRTGVLGRMLRVFLYRARDKWEPRDQGTTPHLIGDALATADFNRDKRPDLICSSHVHGHTALLHLNRGDKGWEIWKPTLIGSSYIWGVAGGDVDGDGWDDVVLTFVLIEREPDRERGGVAVLLNDRKGGLREPQVLVMEDRSIPHPFVRLGDVDKDGRIDVITSNYEGDFRLLLQREKMKFFEEETPELPDLTAQAVQVADIDGDKRPDLVINFSREAAGGMLRAFLVTPKGASAGAKR